jgi:16S rRNA (adenine1518-N6/adenine1519-N6)-dimethyltransferase
VSRKRPHPDGAPEDPARQSISKLQQLKESLAARGLAPQKKFGQNFMIDSNFAAAVARDAQPDEKKLLIEVGPGTGCLTRALLDSHPSARVLAVEIDRGLAALLRETFAEPLASGKLTLLEGDALASKHEIALDFARAITEISEKENRPRRVLCANLPYNAATPLLANFAVDAQSLNIATAIATIQLELAQRLFAEPGESAYGSLTALLALRAEGKIIRKVGGDIFWPRPQVDSAVIRLDYLPWDKSPLRKNEVEPFQDFLQKLFSQRRKTVRAVLKPTLIPESLQLPENARAEDLPPLTLLELFRSTRDVEDH